MRWLPVRTRVKATRTLHRGGLAVPAGSHGFVTGAVRARFYSRTTYTVVFTPLGTSGAIATLTELTARDVRPRELHPITNSACAPGGCPGGTPSGSYRASS